ncbi:MAG: non-hydrolyzing UDP-N-acetylglucosamine 2-epimerase [Candidatus Helarchaeota archaeon]
MKIITIFGTRPEAIKMAPVIKALKDVSQIETKICVTAQHREMLDQVLEIFKIVPDFDLNLMNKNQDLTDITCKVLINLRKLFKTQKPDFVIVHGDTTTTLAASIAAYYEKIPVAHVEAGLRTKDIYSPWPEEINRRVTDAIAEILFAPTKTAKRNLINENISEEKIIVTGNTVIDALLWVKKLIFENKQILTSLQQRFDFLDNRKKLILITGHRRENFGDGIKNLCLAIREISKYDDVQIVYPVHLNPNVQIPVKQLLSEYSNIYLLQPFDYLSFVYLMTQSYIIVTDSGGIQEEAPSLGKPVLVTRTKTERPEAVEAGTVSLVGTNSKTIVDNIKKLLKDNFLYEKMSTAHNPYGDGRASERIKNYFVKKLIKNN